MRRQSKSTSSCQSPMLLGNEADAADCYQAQVSMLLGQVLPLLPPVECAEAAELALGLREALAELSQQEAAVFYLRCLEECSYQQIADHLRIEVSNVGVALHRARARLRELLAAFLVKQT